MKIDAEIMKQLEDEKLTFYAEKIRIHTMLQIVNQEFVKIDNHEYQYFFQMKDVPNNNGLMLSYIMKEDRIHLRVVVLEERQLPTALQEDFWKSVTIRVTFDPYYVVDKIKQFKDIVSNEFQNDPSFRLHVITGDDVFEYDRGTKDLLERVSEYRKNSGK
jgi:hypothetical protein